MDMKPYFVDDSFPDLSRFDGMSKEELDAEIERLEKGRTGKESKKQEISCSHIKALQLHKSD